MEMEEKSDRFRIATFNIRTDTSDDGPDGGSYRWSSRVENVKKVMNDYDWDIIGLQEVRERQLDDLKEMKNYDFIGKKRSENETAEYSPIMYKKDTFLLLKTQTFWLSETPNMISIGWDAAVNRICTFAHFKLKQTNKEIYVLNTHFDHISEEARYQSALLIREYINKLDDTIPLFLLGDFNAEKNEKCYFVLSSFLTDAVEYSPHHVGPVVTCTGVAFEYKPSWDEMMSIDYIFYRGINKIISTATVTDRYGEYYPSDHFPVSLICQV